MIGLWRHFDLLDIISAGFISGFCSRGGQMSSANILGRGHIYILQGGARISRGANQSMGGPLK